MSLVDSTLDDTMAQAQALAKKAEVSDDVMGKADHDLMSDSDYGAMRRGGMSESEAKQRLSEKKQARVAADAGLPAERRMPPVKDFGDEDLGLGNTGRDTGPNRKISDTVNSLLKGGIDVGQGAVGLADIVTSPLGKYGAGAGFEALGYDPKATNEFIAGFDSPELKEAKSNVGQETEFWPSVVANLQNPSVPIQAGVESLPSMMLGGAIGKGFGTASKVLQASIGEGAVQAGQAAQQTRQETGTLTPVQAALAVSSGVVDAAISRLTGGLAEKYGIVDPDVLAAGGKAAVKDAAKTAWGRVKDAAKQVFGGFAEEGFEELVQTAQEQIHQNIAEGKPPMEGVAAGAAQGMLTGGLMGGATNVGNVALEGLSRGEGGPQGDAPPKANFTPQAPGTVEAALAGQPAQPQMNFRDALAAAVPGGVPRPIQKDPLTGLEVKGPEDDMAQAQRVMQGVDAASTHVSPDAEALAAQTEQRRAAEAQQAFQAAQTQMFDRPLEEISGSLPDLPTQRSVVERAMSEGLLTPSQRQAAADAEAEANARLNDRDTPEAEAARKAIMEPEKPSKPGGPIITGEEPKADRTEFQSLKSRVADDQAMAPVLEQAIKQDTERKRVSELGGPAFRLKNILLGDQGNIRPEGGKQVVDTLMSSGMTRSQAIIQKDTLVRAVQDGSINTVAEERAPYGQAEEHPPVQLAGRNFTVQPMEVEGKKAFLLKGKNRGEYVAVERQPGQEMSIFSVGKHGNVNPLAPGRNPFPGASLRVQDGNLTVDTRHAERPAAKLKQPGATPENLVGHTLSETVKANEEGVWRSGPLGNHVIRSGGANWTVRPVTFSAQGNKLFWVYKNGNRFTPSGKYDDAVSFPTLKEAKAFVEQASAGTDGTARETAAEYGNWKNYQIEQPREKVAIVKGPPDVGRVSPRKPSAVGATEHGPGGETLEINTEAIEQSKNHLDKVAAAVQKYNTFFGENPMDWKNPAQVIAEFKKVVVRNLVALHNMMPEELRRRAQLWYEGANRMANDWSPKYEISVPQAAAVMAIHSPQKEWFSNVSLAERTIHIVKDYGDFKWSKDMTNWVRSYIESDSKPAIRDERRPLLKVAERLEGTALKDMTVSDAARFVRVFDETYHDKAFRVLTPEGGFGDFSVNDDGVTKTPVAWPGYATIEKAISVLMDGSQKNISANVGNEHKVRSFFNSILDPRSAKGDVVIDTHAVGAALMKALSGKSIEVNHNFGTTKKGIQGAGGSNITGANGTYGVLADAYREAAAQLGIRPNQLQSITREAIRSMFPDSTKDQITQLVEPIWDRAKSGEISRAEAERQVLEVSGGVKSTPWAGTPAGIGADQMESFNTTRLPPQLREIVPEKSKIQVQLSANTGKIKEFAALRDAADQGNADAGAKLSALAESGLKEILKGTSARVKVEHSTGLYMKYLEPSITASVEFNSDEMAEVVSRLKAFADTFKQEQVHVLEKIYTPRGMEPVEAGYKWQDRSYATRVYSWTTERALSREEIERVIKSSGLAGLTFGDNVVTAYFVEGPGKSIEVQLREFESRIEKAHRSLQGLTSEVEGDVRRFWPYGEGFGAIGWPGTADGSSVLPEKREEVLGRSVKSADRFLKQAEKKAAAGVALEGQAAYAYLPDGTELQRPETRADAVTAAREAIEQLSLDFGPSSVSAPARDLAGVRPAPRTQAGGPVVLDAHITVPESLKERGRVDLVGQVVRTDRDLAVVARVARDPRVETMGFAFTDQNGVIIAQELLSSREPGYVAAFDTPAREPGVSPAQHSAIVRNARNKFMQRLRHKMDRLSQRPGVTDVKLVMWHNHPGGNPGPSNEDVGLTQQIARNVPGFAFHVVLNGDKFGVIELSPAKGDARYVKLDKEWSGVGGHVFTEDSGHRVQFVGTKPLVGSDVSPDQFFVGANPQLVNTPAKLAEFADGWRKQRPAGQVIVAILDAQNKTRAVIPVPAGLFKNVKAFSDFMRGMNRAWGGRGAVAVFNGRGDREMTRAAVAHVRRGVMVDYLDEHGGNRKTLYDIAGDQYGVEAEPKAVRSFRVGEDIVSDDTQVMFPPGQMRNAKPKGRFYSALERAAEQMRQPMKGTDALRFLSSREGVKKAEIEATKLGQFLEGKQRVTPAEVQEYLKSAAVKVEGDKPERIPPGDPRRDENFRRWFGDSKVVDENGKPLVVYHGTTHEISAFRPSKTNPENDFGKGIYTTNSPEDASENYAGVGQDLTSRIERLAERIVQEKDWEYDDPRAKKLAEKRLHGGAESVLPLYLKVENPVVIGEGQNEPTMMNDRQIRKFVRSIDKSVTQARSNPEIGEALEALLTAEDYGEYNAERLIKFAREASIYEEDSKGNLVSSDIVRRALQAAGFDGVIDQTVNKKWGDESEREAPMRGMNADTIHYIAFGPEQAKSATGNRGTFDPDNPSIVAEERQPYGDPHISTSVAEERDGRSPVVTPPSKREIVQILRDHPLIRLKENVKRAFLVGSQATGLTRRAGEGKSDVDILLEVAPRAGVTAAELTEQYRRRLQQHFVKNNIRGVDDSVHPQWDGHRVDVYFTYDADKTGQVQFDDKPKLLLSDRPGVAAEERAPYGVPKEPERKKAPGIPAGMGRPVRVTPMATDDIAARVAAASKGEGTPDGTPISELAPPEFHRNMKRVLQVLDKPQAERLARIYDVFDKEMDVARGRLSWEQGDKEALKLLGVHTREQFLQMAQRGVIFNEPGLRAATRVMYEVEAENRQAMQTLEEAKAKGGGGVDSKEFQDYVASSTDLAAWIMALRGEQAEAARAFGARKDLKGARNPLEKLIGALGRSKKATVGGSGLTNEQIAQVIQIAQQDPGKLPDIVRQIQKPGFWDMVNEWRKGAMLMGVRTYGVNFFGNAFKQALTLAEIPGAAAADYLKTPKGQQRQVYLGEMAAARAGIADFGPAAWEEFVKSSKDALRGVEPFDPESNKYEIRVGAIPGPLGKFIRTPFRLLTVADNFFKTLAKGQSLYREAYRRARNEGLTGENAARRADELVNIGKGSDWQDRRVAGMLEKANRAAEYETFTMHANYDNAGVFGAIAEGVSRLEKSVPAVGLFAPFKGTPANIAYQGYERSPLGWLSVKNRASELADLEKELKQAARPQEKARIQEQIEQKRADFANQVSRAAMGSALFIVAAAMAAAGMLTGSGPSDPDKNRVWRKAGNIPNAIKVGDSDWYAYDRFEPIAATVAMAASVPEAMKETSAVDVGARAIDALHDAFVAKTYLQGMEQLGQLIKHPLVFGKKWLRDLEASFVPAIVGHTADAMDPTVRDNKGGLLDPIKARIPGLTQGLRQVNTGTGEPAAKTERLGGTALAPVNPLGFVRTGPSKGDPLYKEFLDADYAPDEHKTFISIGVGPVGAKKQERVELTPAEMERFRRADEVATRILRGRIQDPAFQRLDPDQKKANFRREYDRASDAVKKSIMPAAWARLQKQLSERRK